MKKIAFFSVLGIAAVVAVIAFASTATNNKKGKDSLPGPSNAASSTCNKGVPGDCLPAVGYLDTADVMWTGDLVQGKVVMINFWATWCQPCKHEIPDLTVAYKKHKDEGFVMLGVLMDADRVTDEQLKEFAGTYNLDYPVVRVDQQLWYDFGEPQALPTTYIYDRSGNRAFTRRGPVSKEELDSLLTKLLAQPTPAARNDS
jgi:thiol-disulfide isomerase/thioredoxin